MKKKHSFLRFLAAIISVLLLLCPSEKGRAPFGELSVYFFQQLFQSEAAREVFNISAEEAVEVFGKTQEDAYV